MTTINDQLLKAASAGDLAGVSQALERGANVNAKDEYNNSSLNLAALWGYAEVVKRLLEAGADIENRGSGGGLTPLANAASRGHSAVAQILLDHGARVTDDLLSILQTKVNILQENSEAGIATKESLTSWKGALDFFIKQRMKQDLQP
jgi:ankyrin repeat protein